MKITSLLKIKNLTYDIILKYYFLNSKEKIYELKTNKKYKGKYKCKRCFIIGNGPSIKNQDLTKLASEYVFTVNQSMRLEVFKTIKPQFHFFADPRYYNLNPDLEEDLEVINLIRALSSYKDITCFFPINAYDFVQKTKLCEDLNISYFLAANTLYEGCQKQLDLTKPIFSVPTVVQFAIQAAVYMGFTDIYLLGCDMTGFEEIRSVDNSMENTYAYELTENEKKRMRRSTMHNGEELFYAYARNYTIYRLLNSYCKNRDINLYNATEGGLLDNIKRVKYEDLF